MKTASVDKHLFLKKLRRVRDLRSRFAPLHLPRSPRAKQIGARLRLFLRAGVPLQEHALDGHPITQKRRTHVRRP